MTEDERSSQDEAASRGDDLSYLIGRVAAHLSYIALRDLDEAGLSSDDIAAIRHNDALADALYGPEWRDGDIE